MYFNSYFLYITFFFQVQFTITVIRSVVIKYFQQAQMNIIQSRVCRSSCWSPSQQADIQKTFLKCWLPSGLLLIPQELPGTQTFKVRTEFRTQKMEHEISLAGTAWGSIKTIKPATYRFLLPSVRSCHSAVGISRTAEKFLRSKPTFISSIHYRHTVVPHEEGGSLKNLLHL